MIKHKGNWAVGTKITAIFSEGVTDVGDGACAVVGHTVNNHRGAINAVTFVTSKLIVITICCADTALDRAINIVLGHIARGCFVDGQT